MLYERLIAPDRPGLPFVNADRIASDRFPGQELEQAYVAAEIAATARDALIAARIDFCTETVFSHESKVNLVTTAAGAGYDVVLHVVMIPQELSGPRVASAGRIRGPRCAGRQAGAPLLAALVPRRRRRASLPSRRVLRQLHRRRTERGRLLSVRRCGLLTPVAPLDPRASTRALTFDDQPLLRTAEVPRPTQSARDRSVPDRRIDRTRRCRSVRVRVLWRFQATLLQWRARGAPPRHSAGVALQSLPLTSALAGNCTRSAAAIPKS